ncbi:putative sodium-coupled neutral amino acid transporter 11 [Wyeomyia smithii]|uniref:putative sodium-coupled neutral amino acid transporter 11 n=1 Tax=Wyeomyia smithii TaxID=174621 RepID=UPI0024682196|nr:putative sodium-coupled neutral amino acid transporter 11 [Wyeomyia smithii]XP_055530401.1 putative sodium-coupled neutral amino acid transporter 11 [Wyeomyia smithii]
MDSGGKKQVVSEFSYMLQRQASDDSTEAAAFDDINSLMKNEESQASGETLSSLPQASFNYINSIVGSGVIGIPYALHRAGFGLGLFLLVIVAVITDYSLILMVRCGHLSGRFSYPGVMEAAYGKGGYYLLSLLQFMYPFLAMISYNVVVGDTLSKVLVRFVPSWGNSMGAVRFGVVLVVTVFVIIPLCLYKNVSRLAKASFLSLACVIIILIAVIYKLLAGDYSVVPDTPESWRFAHGDLIPAVGIMAFAFMCHHNTFLVYQSMRNATLERWVKVTHLSVGCAWLVAAFFGIAGYCTFRALSQGDLLENYCWDDDLMNFARVLFSISILLTFPIECFVSREIVRTQIKRFYSSEVVEYDTDKDPSHATGEEDQKSVATTLVIVFAAFILSPYTECLGPVLELNGLLAAIPLAYILPGLAYIQLSPHSLFSQEKLPAAGLVLFGTIVTISGAALLMPNLIGDCRTGIIMGYCREDELAINGTLYLASTPACVTERA